MELVAEKHLTVNEAHQLLKSRRDQAGALSYEQQNTFDYLDDLIRLSDKDAKAMKSELTKAGLNEDCAARIVNLLPKKDDEVKLILADQVSISDDVIKAVCEISKTYLKDAKEPAKIKQVEAPQLEQVTDELTASTEKPKEEETE